MGLWFRIDTATFVFWHKCSVQHISVCVSLGDREKHCWIEKFGFWSCPQLCLVPSVIIPSDLASQSGSFFIWEVGS